MWRTVVVSQGSNLGARQGPAKALGRPSQRIMASAQVVNGSMSREEAAKYSPDQLDFLMRKRSESVGTGHAGQNGVDSSAAGSSTARGLSPQQQAFLERKRRETRASPAPATSTRGCSVAPARPVAPVPSSNGAAAAPGLSPEQVAFLERKRRKTSTPPALTAPTRGRSPAPRRPTSSSHPPPKAGLSAEQQAFLERRRHSETSASPSPQPTRRRSASTAPRCPSSSRRPATYTATTTSLVPPAGLSPEQWAFLVRKQAGGGGAGTGGGLSLSSTSPSNEGMRSMEELLASLEATIQSCVADGLITREEAASCSPEQLEFLVRKRTGQELPPAASGGSGGGTTGASSFALVRTPEGGEAGRSSWSGVVVASMALLGLSAGVFLVPDGLPPKDSLRLLPWALQRPAIQAPAQLKADAVKLADPTPAASAAAALKFEAPTAKVVAPRAPAAKPEAPKPEAPNAATVPAPALPAKPEPKIEETKKSEPAPTVAATTASKAEDKMAEGSTAAEAKAAPTAAPAKLESKPGAPKAEEDKKPGFFEAEKPAAVPATAAGVAASAMEEAASSTAKTAVPSSPAPPPVQAAPKPVPAPAPKAEVKESEPAPAAAMAKEASASSADLARELAAGLAADLAAQQPMTSPAQAQMNTTVARLTAQGGIGLVVAGMVVAAATLLPVAREALLSLLSGQSPQQRFEDLRKQLQGQQGEVSKLQAQAQAAQREFERSQAKLRAMKSTLDTLSSLLDKSRQQLKR